MNLEDYTMPAAEVMHFKHGSHIRFTLTSGDTVLEDKLVPIENVGGAITVAGFLYNRLSMSGGVSWWHPETGVPIEKPSYRLRAREADLLIGDDACDCERCCAEA